MPTTWHGHVGLWDLGIWTTSDSGWWIVVRPTGAVGDASYPILICDRDKPGVPFNVFTSFRVSVERAFAGQLPEHFALRSALWRWSKRARHKAEPYAFTPTFIRPGIRRCRPRRAR